MTFEESICFAKVYAAAIGLAPANTVTRRDKEIAAEALKHMADQSQCWNQTQKDMYKLLVDATKEHS